MLRILLTLLLCVVPIAAAQAAGQQQYSCQDFAEFVEPGSAVATQYHDYQPQAWQGWQKQRVDYALSMVKSVAPGLVANAAAGGRIRLVNSGRAEPVYLQSYLTEIYFYPKFWTDFGKFTPWKLSDMLAHELTHMVDNGNDLSRSSDWKVFTHDRVVACRHALHKRKHHSENAASEFIARQCGLPSAYAVNSPPESLAECVSAAVFDNNFHLPLDMAEFVEQRVLQPQPYTNFNQYMHQAWSAELSHQFEQALALYRKALLLDPLSVRARQGLISCLIHLGKNADAMAELEHLSADLNRESDLTEVPTELNGVREMLARLRADRAAIKAQWPSRQK
jgi:hypothetical protein